MQEMQFDLWVRKIPHAVEHLSPYATTTEPMLYSPCLTTREATAMGSLHIATKSSPHSLQIEKSPRAAMKTQHRQK